MSSSPEPQRTTVLAKHPFDDPKADIILRTSDGVDFRVYKLLLSLVSPVFKDMFEIPQPTGTDGSGEKQINNEVQVVELPETSRVMKHLLSWCDPRAIPSTTAAELTLKDICDTLEAVDKYEMESLGGRALSGLKFHITDHPLSVYAIACSHQDLDASGSEIARQAAKELLKHEIPFTSGDVDALNDLSATNLQRLYQYHVTCGVKAQSLTRDWSWSNEVQFDGPWANRCQYKVSSQCSCGKDKTYTTRVHISNTSFHVADWWVEYMSAAGMALRFKPCRETILFERFDTDFLQKRGPCTCTSTIRFRSMLAEFNAKLAAEVDKVVDQVSLNISVFGIY
ncbi:hypothetical protein C8J56DRAFT_962698 [Mycena floridula]|nr:hypothetical protein C8J56DRAFT_962698 [Mycena floridula]